MQSNVKPVLTRLVLGNKVRLDLDIDTFYQAKTAKQYLCDALFMEEKFDYVMQNYRELEQTFLNIALDVSLFFEQNWENGMNDLHLVNRRIFNLLTTSRAYLDHIVHHIRSMYGNGSAQEAKVKEHISKEYDESFAYQFVDALRNFAQHRDIPVHGIRYPGAWVDTKSGRQRRHVASAKIQIKKLSDDEKFKKSVLDKIDKQVTELDVRFVIRQYMESLGRIHTVVRETINPEVEKHDQLLVGFIDKLAAQEGKNDGDYAHLALFDENDVAHERVEISRDIIDRRRAFEGRNRFITGFATQFVSSELLKGDFCKNES